MLEFHGGHAPWSPHKTPPRLPSHNQWNLYFASDDGASHYFLYSALIHDPAQRMRRYVLRELLLMMNWRIVHPPGVEMSTRLAASLMGVRRLAPIALIGLGAAAAMGGYYALVWCGCVRRKRKYL